MKLLTYLIGQRKPTPLDLLPNSRNLTMQALLQRANADSSVNSPTAAGRPTTSSQVTKGNQ